VPEQEGENQSDAETHKPGDEHESSIFDVCEEAQDGHPFRDFPRCLCKYFALPNTIGY